MLELSGLYWCHYRYATLSLSGRVGIYSPVCAFVVGAGVLYHAVSDQPYSVFSGTRTTLIPILILLGIVLFSRSLIVQCNEDRDAAFRAASLISPGSQPPLGLAARDGREAKGSRKWNWILTPRETDGEIRLQQVLSGLRAFGLIATATIFVILVPCWLFHARSQPNLVGLRVFLLRPSKSLTVPDQWGDALVVHIDAQSQWSLNGQEVSRTELLAKLNRALSLHAGKVVFVDSEDSNSWASIVEVIDSIQGACDAKIVLLGRESREESTSQAGTRSTSRPTRN